MMVSPVRTPSRVQDTRPGFDQDPMEWDIDEVVAALCFPEGLLRTSCKYFPDPISLEKKIRENHVTGDVLLQEIQEKDLGLLGIESLGHRKMILRTIKKLQRLSQRYQEELEEDDKYTNPFIKPQHLMTPQDLHRQESPGTELGTYNLSTSPKSHIHPTSELTPGRRTNFIPQNVDAVSGNLAERKDGLTLERDQPEQRPTLGERYVVDASGKRRLNIQLITTVPLDSKEPQREGAETVSARLDDHVPVASSNAESKTPQSQSPRLVENISQQPVELVQSLDRTSSPQGDQDNMVDGASEVQINGNISETHERRSSVVARSKHDDLEQPGQVKEDSPLEDAPPIRALSKSGLLTVDEKGRKRLIPEDVSKVKPKAIHRRPSQTYLGSKALPVDSLFYGDTPFGENVVLSDASEVTKRHPPGAIKSLINSYWRSVGQASDWTLTSHEVASDGQRICVNNRMKYFFFANSMLRALSDGRKVYGIKPHPERAMLLANDNDRKVYGMNPYPERILRKHYAPSITLISSSTHEFSVSREKRSAWSDTPEESVLARLGENEIRDWDYLEKWTLPVHDQTILPKYGDSDSEDEQDAEILRDMRKDEAKKPGLSGETTRTAFLTPEEVSQIIDDNIVETIENWHTRKLPGLQRKAPNIWVRARRDHTRSKQVIELSTSVDKLENRLVKLKKELKRERYKNLKELWRQCASMHETIKDLEMAKWTINILKLKSKPPKILSSESTHRSNNLKEISKSTELSEDSRQHNEEDGSEEPDDIMEDFIDNDEMISEGLADDEGAIDPGFFEDDVSMHSSNVNEIDMEQPAIDPDAISSDTVVSGNKDLAKRTNSLASKTLAFTSDKEQADDNHNDVDDHASLFESPHEGSLSGAQTQLQLKPRNVIDLTQLSDLGDSRVHVSPFESDESQGIRTPPLDTTDPFSRFRNIKGESARDVKVKQEFRHPPRIKHDEYDEDLELANSRFGEYNNSSGEESATSRQLTPGNLGLPGLWEFDKIKALSPEIIQEKQDRKRLLVYVILRTPIADRQKVLIATDSTNSAEIQIDVWRALVAIENNWKTLGGDKSEGGLMILGYWYIIWHHNKIFREKGGIPVNAVGPVINSERDFETFYQFVQEVFSKLEAAKLTERLPVMSDSTSKGRKEGRKEGKKDKKMKRQRRLDGDIEEEDISPRKKRKYIVPESQEGVQKRQDAHARLQERIVQQEALRQRRGMSDTDLGMATSLIVNGKTGDESIVINPEIGKRIQPYQLEGVQFMWGEIVSNAGQVEGCLLAHTMGLGKTMQVITLLTTIAEASNHPNEAIRNQVPETLRESRTLVLCPTSLVDNWNDEFNLWTPPSAMEHLGDVFPIHAKLKPKERFNVISNWVEQGGILIVGYSLFRDMIMRTQRSKPDGKVQGLTDDELNKIRDCLLNKANLVVADEAHAMKKNETGITRAAAMIRTHSRIALSGSPLANNLEEYFTLVDWIAPKYLGTRVEFRDRYAEPINSGFYADAHIKDYRKGLKMLEVLKAELDPKVQRKDISAIKDLLPGKTEFLLRMPLTDIQQQAYSLFVRHMEQENNLSRLPPTQLWGWLAILRLLCNHPKCFLEKLRGGDQNSKQNSSKKRSASTAKVLKEADDADIAPEDAPEDDVLLTKPISSLGIPQEVVDQQLALFEDLGTKVDSIKLAHKVQILFGILRYSKIVGDKVLVFSQSIPTLDYLEDQLKANLISHFRLTGSTNMASRQKLTKDFNNNDTSVFLVSTRAGGQGLNLFGANRVVIMDDSFNPMHEEQAIGRVYRLGQKKHVYVYRLTIGGTFEQALQDQSLFKLQLATRVVDRKSQKRHASKDARQYIFQPKVVEQNDLKEYKEKYDKVLNRILCAPETASIIRSIDLTETFHVEVDESLTAEEAKETEELIKEEKLRRSDPVAYELRKAKKAKAIADSNYEESVRQQNELLAQSAPQRRFLNGPKPEVTALPSTRPQKGVDRATAPQVVDLTTNEPSSTASGAPVTSDPIAVSNYSNISQVPTNLQLFSTPSESLLTNAGSSASGFKGPRDLPTPKLPNLDPVLGGRTRIGDGSPGGAGARTPLPDTAKATTPRLHSRNNSISTEHIKSSTPSLNLAVSANVNDGRAIVREETAALISAHLESQKELGLLTVTDPQRVASMLAATMERLAYKDASGDEHYYMELEESRKKITHRKGRALQGFIDPAIQRIERESAPRPARAINSPLSIDTIPDQAVTRSPTMILGREPTHFENGSPSSPTAGRLRSGIASPLGIGEPYRPPYPALAGMMQRESGQ